MHVQTKCTFFFKGGIISYLHMMAITFSPAPHTYTLHTYMYAMIDSLGRHLFIFSKYFYHYKAMPLYLAVVRTRFIETQLSSTFID